MVLTQVKTIKSKQWKHLFLAYFQPWLTRRESVEAITTIPVKEKANYITVRDYKTLQKDLWKCKLDVEPGNLQAHSNGYINNFILFSFFMAIRKKITSILRIIVVYIYSTWKMLISQGYFPLGLQFDFKVDGVNDSTLLSKPH